MEIQEFSKYHIYKYDSFSPNVVCDSYGYQKSSYIVSTQNSMVSHHEYLSSHNDMFYYFRLRKYSRIKCFEVWKYPYVLTDGSDRYENMQGVAFWRGHTS